MSTKETFRDVHNIWHAHVYTFSFEQCDQVNFLLLSTLTSSTLLTQRNSAELHSV